MLKLLRSAVNLRMLCDLRDGARFPYPTCRQFNVRLESFTNEKPTFQGLFSGVFMRKWRRGWDSNSLFTVFRMGFLALNRLCVCLPQPLTSWLSQHKKPIPAKGRRKTNISLSLNNTVPMRLHVRHEIFAKSTNHSSPRLPFRTSKLI